MSKTETQKKTVIERPPVVVVMGHIDHGKSTLLDYIRKTNIVDKEAGGITQHVSAYEVEAEMGGKKRRVTFLDTPGHEAFQTLRARGAKVADVAILVVSTEDGVKPQTLEALKWIKEQNVPFVVALNKIDRPNSNIDRTKITLAENEVYVEGYGGTISSVPVSAKTGEGIPELLELVFLTTDVLDLKGTPENTATGVVIESKLDPRKGISATLIVKDGSLKSGQFVAAGESMTVVRIMENDLGQKITTASFSTPVTIIGWSELVPAGAEFKTFDTKKEAIEYTQTFKKVVSHARPESVNPDEALLPIIIKADTLGSLEAINFEMNKIGSDQIKAKIVSQGVGAIGEGDVKAANVGKKAYIFGFNTKIDAPAKILAERDGISIEVFSIIYKLTERIAALLEEQRPRIRTEEVTGAARILRTFSKQKDKQIIGGKVDEGFLAVGETVKIVRRGTEIGTGRIRGLQQQKQEVKEIKAGTEFGSLIESKFELAVGDTLQSFQVVEK
ncbi:MAG TPA: translation initiation factor IF-2 [Candidatus Nanoarchaeia archaeon]|nr:translation initiation factor IF-2 [Candidatus Nanoarchaeia archaeon]